MGFAAGFQVGAQAVERGLKMREEDKLKRELAQAYAKPEEFVDYTPEQQRQIQGLQAVGGYDVQAVPGAEGQAPTLRYSAKPGSMYYDDMGQPEAPIEVAPQRVQRYGGQTVAGQFDPMQLQGFQMREAARAIGASGDPVRAAQMLAEATRMEREAVEAPLRLQALQTQVAAGKLGLTKTEQDIAQGGIQLTDAQRKQRMQEAFDTGFADINKQTFEKPEERTAAILSLVERTQGVQAAEQLRANYSQNELNQISLQSKKFDEGFRQSRAKGVIPALEWFDEQNTSFKLERDPKNPFRVIQVNTDNTRSVFADAKNERELGMIIDAKAKPGGFLELAKYDLDVKKAEDIAAYYRARTQNDRLRGGETEAQQNFQRKVDSVLEGYQTAIGLGPAGQQAAAIYAREYDQLRATTPKGLRAPPSLSALNQAQQPEKPVKVEEAGVQYKMGGKLMQTDGRGGFISAKGVLPDDRPAALKAAGVSDNNASRLMWSNDGDAVMFNNEEYDVRDKRDMKKLKSALEAYDVMQGRIAEEDRLRSNPTGPSGFQGARTTGLGPASSYGAAPGAPSIYGR
jgi:hypothetical protein